MKRTRIAMLATAIALFAGLEAARAAPVTLPDGTPITLQLVEGIKSGREKLADPVSLVVRDTSLGANGEILVANGARAEGTVTRSRGSKVFGRGGKIDFIVDYVIAVDGTQIQVRAIERKHGQRRTGVGVGAGLIISWPLAFIKGQNITFPPGFQFTAYVNGDQEVDLKVGAAGVRPLVVRDFDTMAAGGDEALAVFTVENPNAGLGLRNALIDITAYNASGNVVGSNGNLDSLDPAHTLWALAPGETRTLVKRIRLRQQFDEATVHVAQPWERWGAAPVALGDVPILFSQWKSDTKITGMVRNDGAANVRVDVVATVREGGEIVGIGRAGIKKLRAGKTGKFTIDMVGRLAPGAAFEITAVSSVEAVAR